MNPAYISALAALAGSVIGGLTSLATSWLAQRTQVRARELTRNRRGREAARPSPKGAAAGCIFFRLRSIKRDGFRLNRRRTPESRSF
jgi:hypothetical protein